MKKFILCLFVSLIYLSCDGYDANNCFKTVAQKYDKVSIIKNYRYIAIDSKGKTHYIETMNGSNTDITKDVVLKFYKMEK